MGRRLFVPATLAALIVTMLAVVGANAAQRAPHCSGGKVRSTVVYVHRAGGAKHHATGCARRPATGSPSFATMLSTLRGASLPFLSRKAGRALRSPAARRLAKADAATDAAMAARLTSTARAAAITHDSSSGPVTLPPGAEEFFGTVERYSTTQWDEDEPQVGSSYDVQNETKGKKQGGDKRKRVLEQHLMDRCPDASGVAHGTLEFKLHETTVVGGASITEDTAFNGDVVAHFDDSARIGAVEITGTWSYATGSGAQRSVSGTMTASGFHQGADGPPFSNYVDIKTAVTTGTDDGIATAGGYLGSWVTIQPGLIIQDSMLDPLQKRALSGLCVKVVPDEPEVHVAPRGTVTISAHLTDHDGTEFNGPITAYNAAGRVTPATAQGDPHAIFTYTAPATAKAGDTDVVVLNHLSRRGKGLAGTVKVIFDGDPFPARFNGTWTTVFSQASSIGWTETVHGTATYVRDPASPHTEGAERFVVYKVQSASVDWSVSGSGNPAGDCLNTYSGSGSDEATSDPPVTAQITLEDTTGSPYASSPPPNVFAYSIAANGDGNDPPMYTDSHTPADCGGDAQYGIATDYIEAGWPGNYGMQSASDTPQTTDSARTLSGHYSGPDATNTKHVEEDWSFSGSG